MKVAIIPCTSQKSETPGPAREVWTGSHFQYTLLHAEEFYDKVLVMSYKYGFIDPGFEIEPYDINIQNEPAIDRLKWWWLVKEDIKEVADQKPELVAIYTGNFERARIIREFFLCGVRNIVIPWEGLGVGERMQQVYDRTVPFDEERLTKGEYALPEDFLDKPTPKPETDLEWESEDDNNQ